MRTRTEGSEVLRGKDFTGKDSLRHNSTECPKVMFHHLRLGWNGGGGGGGEVFTGKDFASKNSLQHNSTECLKVMFHHLRLGWMEGGGGRSLQVRTLQARTVYNITVLSA